MNKFIILFLLLMPIAVCATPISPIIPSGTTLPSNCRTGALFIDTDQDTDGALYQCVDTDSWKIVGSGAGGGIDTSGTPVAFDIARFTDVDTVEGRSYVEFIADLAIITVDDVDDTPVDAETDQPISSNWAYDHVDAADPHTGYALESLLGDAIEADDFVKTGTTLTLQAEIPHTDAVETVTGEWELPYKNYTVWTTAPTGADKVVGRDYLAGLPWNPCGLDVGISYWVTLTDDDPDDVYVVYRDIGGKAYFSTIQAAMKVATKAAAYDLTAADMNSIYIMTAAGDVNIPDGQCDTATGKWLTVKTKGTFLNSITSDDTTPDKFVLSNGTVLTATAGWELDLGGAAGNQATVVCLEAHTWYVTGEIGTCVDGGAGD